MTAPVLSGPSATGGGPVLYPHDYAEQVADIGNRVLVERRARGWSQQRLADEAHLGVPQVRRLEQGPAPMQNFLAACDALGIEFSYLVSREWRPPAVSPLTPRQITVLAAVEAEGTLARAAQRLGMTRPQVAARMSEAAHRLDVVHLPLRERRSVMLRVARERGLLPTETDI